MGIHCVFQVISDKDVKKSAQLTMERIIIINCVHQQLKAIVLVGHYLLSAVTTTDIVVLDNHRLLIIRRSGELVSSYDSTNSILLIVLCHYSCLCSI